MENLVNYAVSYAEHGFSVIPVLNKKPLIKFANRPPLGVDEIKEIWRKNPTASIALKTDKFLVVDVDRHQGDGMLSIKQLNHDEWFKATLFERTKSGGFHFYFAKPTDKQITQDIGFLPNVDIKAHQNNYVVCSPSPGYIWLNQNPIQPLPGGLLELILKKQAEARPAGEIKPGYRPGEKNFTAKMFEMVVNGLGAEGGRNNQLASFVSGLLWRGVDPYAAAELALITNSNTAEPLPESEVIKTVNSMIDKELRRRAGNG